MRKLPAFYWTGDTPMRCLREAIGGTLRYAYSHHIQRLMVTGNFALLAGVAPREIERWYLAVYADAIEWVEMPNTLGMAVFADGGQMASKPYAAYGDAVVPQITEAIGRAMVQFEAAPEFNRIGATLTMVNSRECDLTSTWPAVIWKA
jgi:deoxyribodipyrimidine photolyase-like uncharacterized protein